MKKVWIASILTILMLTVPLISVVGASGNDVNPNRTTIILQDEGDNIQENKDQNDFCILIVWTYKWYPPLGFGPAPFTLLKCKDLDTGKTRYGISGLFGYKFYIDLQRGHTYNISTIRGRYSDVIKLSRFFNDLWLYVGMVPEE